MARNCARKSTRNRDRAACNGCELSSLSMTRERDKVGSGREQRRCEAAEEPVCGKIIYNNKFKVSIIQCS